MKYIVNVIALLGSNNKMLKAGELVDEACFNRPVADLIKEEYIRKPTAKELNDSKEDTPKKELTENDKLAAKVASESAAKAQKEADEAAEIAKKAEDASKKLEEDNAKKLEEEESKKNGKS